MRGAVPVDLRESIRCRPDGWHHRGPFPATRCRRSPAVPEIRRLFPQPLVDLPHPKMLSPFSVGVGNSFATLGAGRVAQRLAQLPYTQLVGGSNPSSPTKFLLFPKPIFLVPQEFCGRGILRPFPCSRDFAQRRHDAERDGKTEVWTHEPPYTGTWKPETGDEKLRKKMVVGEGFEPSKGVSPADLQSAPIDHSGILPRMRPVTGGRK